MNLTYLKYAVEVAKCGSINKAAEKLFIGQPNLSRSIKELEDSIGTAIFVRSAKGMELTPDGETFINYARSLLKQVDDIENMFADKAVPKKRFSISVPRASYIGEAFANFSLGLSYEKNVEILYKETNSSRTIKNILEDNYNLGIIRYAKNYEKYYNQLFAEKGLISEFITDFKYVLVMSKDSPLVELDEITFNDLANYIEVAHADPFVPFVPPSTVKKEELPESTKRRIFLFERASQFEILSKNVEAFMWVSPIPQDTLCRYKLVQRECEVGARVYRDVLVYKKDYKLSKLDNSFIASLLKAKRSVSDNSYDCNLR